MVFTFARRWFAKRRNGGRVRPVFAPPLATTLQITPSEVYTPTQPQTDRCMFVGREDEIDIVVRSLTEDKAHVVLYSERGRGKTSLANILVETLRRRGLIVARHQCDAGSTFDSVIRGLLRVLPSALLDPARISDMTDGCATVLPVAPVRPEDVVAALAALRARTLICVVDEFDRLSDIKSRTLFADTIKQLSDRGLPMLFFIIGVSENLEQLLGQHPSIQRNVVAVPLPLLSDIDILTLVQTGARKAELTFPAEMPGYVAVLSRGRPHVAQLLGLRLAQAAARRNTRNIEACDLHTAIDRLIRETPHAVAQRYAELTENGSDYTMRAALFAIAYCTQNIWGQMTVAEKPDRTVQVGGRLIDGRCWSRLLQAGMVRICPGEKNMFACEDAALLQYCLFMSARGRRALGGARLASEPAHADTKIDPVTP